MFQNRSFYTRYNFHADEENVKEKRKRVKQKGAEVTELPTSIK
jgi:hypothetical protein